MADLFDLHRVDHVVGLYRTYYFPSDGSAPAFVPADEPAQIANGERVLADPARRARAWSRRTSARCPDFVRASLERLGIPGYRVQRWEKNWEAGGDRLPRSGRLAGRLGGHHRHARHRVAGGLVRRARAGGAGAAAGAAAALGPAGARAGPLRRGRARRAARHDLRGRLGPGAAAVPGRARRARARERARARSADDNWTYRMPDGPRGAGRRRGRRERLRALAARSGRAAGRARRGG